MSQAARIATRALLAAVCVAIALAAAVLLSGRISQTSAQIVATPPLVPELRARAICDAKGRPRGMLIGVTAPGVYTIEFDVDDLCGI